MLTYFTVVSLPALLTATPVGAVGVEAGAFVLAGVAPFTLVGVALAVLPSVCGRTLAAEAVLQINAPSFVHTRHLQTLLDVWVIEFKR